MNWYKARYDSLHGEFTSAKLFKNDENIKPSWIVHPAENTEFHLQYGKDSLLLVIGESWTYGEGVKDIATGIQQYSLDTQIRYGFGSRLAKGLNTDFYQYAVPGNSNGNMFKELIRILEYLNNNFSYKKIYICMQMTDQSREQCVLKQDFSDHPLYEHYNSNKKISFDDWLSKYDEIFLDILEETIKKYSNIDAIVWKNFSSFLNKKEYNSFKIINRTWIEHSAHINGKKLRNKKFQSIGWLQDIQKFYTHRIKFNIKDLNEQLDIIEESNKFINENYLHNGHPNEFGHLTWAVYLLDNSGWKSE